MRARHALLGLWLACCGHRRDLEEHPHPCDPTGHTPSRTVWLEQLACLGRPGSIDWMGDRFWLEGAIADARAGLCEPDPGCPEGCTLLDAAVLELQLIEALTALPQRYEQMPACQGEVDRALWRCLAVGDDPPMVALPDRFGAWIRPGDAGIEEALLVGPLIEGGPAISIRAGSVDTGCGTSVWGADAAASSGTWVPLDGPLDLTGYTSEETATEAARVYQALLDDLRTIRRGIERPPAECREKVPKSNQSSGGGPRALWDCLGLTPLPEAMQAMILFRIRYTHPERGVTSTRQVGLDEVTLEGPLIPGGPVLRLVSRRDGVRSFVASEARLDPRWRGAPFSR